MVAPTLCSAMACSTTSAQQRASTTSMSSCSKLLPHCHGQGPSHCLTPEAVVLSPVCCVLLYRHPRELHTDTATLDDSHDACSAALYRFTLCNHTSLGKA